MAVTETIRPQSEYGTANWTAKPSGTRTAVLADDTDSTYIEGPVTTLFNTNSQLQNHTVPADHERHRIRGRWRARRGDTAGTITFEAWGPIPSEDATVWTGMITVTLPTSFTEFSTPWVSNFVHPTEGLKGVLPGGGTLALVSQVDTPSTVHKGQVSATYIDIDCRHKPTFVADIKDAAGVSKVDGTVTDTDQPRISFSSLNYDGLPSRSWVVTVKSGSTQIQQISGQGDAPTELTLNPIDNGSYTVELKIASTIRNVDAFESNVTTLSFSVTTPPKAPANLRWLTPSLSENVLDWEGVDFADGYRIEKWNGTDWVTDATVGPSVTSYSLPPLGVGEDGDTYRVVAFNEGGDSPPTNEVHVFGVFGVFQVEANCELGGYVITLEIGDIDPPDMTVVRHDLTLGGLTPVRGLTGLEANSSSRTVDYEAPMNHPVGYWIFEGLEPPFVPPSVGPEVFPAQTLAEACGTDQMYLRSLFNPVNVTAEFCLGPIGQVSYQPRVGVFPVIGRRDPVVVSDEQETARGTLRLIGQTNNEVNRLRSILTKAGEPTLLVFDERYMLGQSGVLYFQPLSVKEEWLNQDNRVPQHALVIDYVEISPPALAAPLEAVGKSFGAGGWIEWATDPPDGTPHGNPADRWQSFQALLTSEKTFSTALYEVDEE